MHFVDIETVLIHVVLQDHVATTVRPIWTVRKKEERSSDSVSYRYVGIHVEIKRQVPMFQKVQRSMSIHRKAVPSWYFRKYRGSRFCEASVCSNHVF